MTDMLVKLYALPPLQPLIDAQAQQGIVIRRALPPEKHIVAAWVDKHFSKYWMSETEIAFTRQPVTCFLAVENGVLIGFGCHDTTFRGAFGPTGVDENLRGRGTGRALLLACLHDMRVQGYGYAIIGWAGPVEFYQKAVGAIPIEGSRPGVYEGLLRVKESEK
jgi:GNAT superfamily N-acetyltransferase